MSTVFISYRRADSATFSGRIYDRLTAKFGRPNVFKDVDNIPPGVKFADYILDSLRQCTVALVVIGPRWLDARGAQGDRRLDDPTDFVRLEVETALSLGLVVIPLLVDGAAIPASADLPETLRPLVMFNALVVREDPDFAHDMDRVIGGVERAFASRADAGALARATPSSPPNQPSVTDPQLVGANVPGAPIPAAGSGAPLPGVGSAKPAAAALPKVKQAESTRTPHIWRTLLAGLAVVLVVTSFAFLLNGHFFNMGTGSNTGSSNTRLATATATPSPTATVTTAPAGPFTGTPTLQDPLTDNAVGGWLSYTDQYHSCGFRGGQYHATVAPNFGIECVNSNMSLQNFALEVTMTILKDGPTAGGLSFRRVSSDRLDSRGYQLIIYQSGRMVLAECPGASNCSVSLGDKTATTFSSGIGMTNIIGIVANGSQLSIYANGQLVMSATDGNYSSGYISLNASYASASGDVAYANLKVWQM